MWFKIVSNSDPHVVVTEPTVLSLRVMRDGDGNDVASVKYRTIDGTAKHAFGDYEQIIEQTVVFNIGEMEKAIPVAILDDQTAEGNETFYIQLYGIQGEYNITLTEFSPGFFKEHIFMHRVTHTCAWGKYSVISVLLLTPPTSL